MRKLTKENIEKKQVETIAQFKVLEYLKRNLLINDFELYLFDTNTIKVIDKNLECGYFQFNNDTKEIDYKEFLIDTQVEL